MTAEAAETAAFVHPRGLTRRAMVQVGAVGLLGLGLEHLPTLRAGADDWIRGPVKPKRKVIFLFLSGGLAQHESFDPKPDAAELICPPASAQISLPLPMSLPLLRLWALWLSRGTTFHPPLFCLKN
jgi:hypothetical protein